jgi:hypothetical protein
MADKSAEIQELQIQGKELDSQLKAKQLKLEAATGRLNNVVEK